MVATKSTEHPVLKRVRTVSKRLEDRRLVYESEWQQIADYISPDKGITDDPRYRDIASRHSKLYDGTGPKEKDDLVASMLWIMANPEQAWFEYAPLDPSLDDNTRVQRYLERIAQMTLLVLSLPETRFYLAFLEALDDEATFGTGVVFNGYQASRGVYYMPRPLAEVYAEHDSEGRLVRILRKWTATADEVFETFGRDAAHAAKLVGDGEGDTRLTMRHLVERKPSIGAPAMYDAISLPFVSVYTEEEDDGPIRVGGFEAMPYCVGRWKASSSSSYGVGPGHRSLADVKTLNAAVRTWLRLGQKAADPPMVGPDDGIVGGKLNTAPGGLTLVERSLSGDARPAPLNTGAAPQMADYIRQGLAESVRDMYFATTRRLPERDRMTATEINARQIAALAVLSPYALRIQEETLAPMVMHALMALRRQGALPEPPAELRGKRIKVRFRNSMTNALNSTRVIGTQRWLTDIVTPLAAIDEGVLDMVEAEGAARVAARDLGATAEAMRSREEVAERRQARAERAQAAAAIEQSAQVASSARDAGAAALDFSRAGAQR